MNTCSKRIHTVQTDGETNRQTDGHVYVGRSTGDQKSSLELSVQLS